MRARSDAREQLMLRRFLIAASIALRACIAGAFVYAISHPSLPQMHDSATRAREIAWPIGLVGVPIVLRLAHRNHYPWLFDVLLALPVAIDSIGNVLNWYHRWDSYDTMNHGVSWCALALLVAVSPPVWRLPTWACCVLAIGAGAVGAIVWELGEYAAFIHNAHYNRTAYPDTLTDLLAGLVGAVVAAGVVIALRQPMQSAIASSGSA